ncbi:hypothetical protein RE432_18275 [Pusillimonas sp. SM2304]|uniref:hypothetical protein n=1 Tax=Pusillimonas sp. SM2304 TaxID=3073241 RepID=UPI00287651D4|nr:hypothetical protein [Pusillimonas sp. SM2304]MDS1142384.1 hypothetical protein [Pusillimonas sp. SM2304]
MHIKLSPYRSVRDEAKAPVIEVMGEKLIIEGTEYDFSGVPDGATLPYDAIDCQHIVGDVERIDGVLHLTITYPLGPPPWAGKHLFDQPIIDPADGLLELPQ